MTKREARKWANALRFADHTILNTKWPEEIKNLSRTFFNNTNGYLYLSHDELADLIELKFIWRAF